MSVVWLVVASVDASSTLTDTSAAFLWAIAGILLGGAFTYLATRVQLKHNYKSAQRDRLLALRTESFRRLWQITGTIQRNPDKSLFKRFPQKQLLAKFNNWYFDDGGIYLTNDCREVYFAMLDELNKLETSAPLVPETYQALYNAASKLRATLALEIDTRTSASPRVI